MRKMGAKKRNHWWTRVLNRTEVPLEADKSNMQQT